MINDKPLHAFCITRIKNNIMMPYDFKSTSFYESNSDFLYPELQITWDKDELLVCSVIIDKDNFSILTTRRLLTKQNGELHLGSLKGATSKSMGDIRDHKDKVFTIGVIKLQDGNELKYFIETREASMVMAYGVKSLLQANDITTRYQIDSIKRLWIKRNNQTRDL